MTWCISSYYEPGYLRAFTLKTNSLRCICRTAGSALNTVYIKTPILYTYDKNSPFSVAHWYDRTWLHCYMCICVSECMCLFVVALCLSLGSFWPKVMASVCNETIWHTDPLPLRLRGFWLWREKVNYRSEVSPELSKAWLYGSNCTRILYLWTKWWGRRYIW